MPYATALVITLLVEVPLYALVLGLARAVPVRTVLWAAVVVNLATHPVVWLVLTSVPAHLYWPWFVAVELFAWLGEAGALGLLLRRVWRGAAALPLLGATALLTNTASVLAGFLLLER